MLPIKVPPLGESIVEATVLRWLKNEGDAVASGETLVELETDKITVEVPAPRAGSLASRAVAEGTVVKVGDLLGEVDETTVGASAEAQSSASATATPADARQASEAAGATGGLSGAGQAGASAPPASSRTVAAAATPAAGPVPPSTGAPSGDGDVKSSPAARRVAAASGIDVAGVTGTGRGGVISKPDVLERAASAPAPAPAGAPAAAPTSPAPPPAAAPQPPSPKPPRAGAPSSPGERETREKMTTRRKRIAENLLQSQHNTAHLTTFNEIDMSAVNSLRERMRERVEKEHGVKLTFMPFFVKAACMALESYPVVNAQVDGDSIIYKHYVNMGIAVASDAGLVVPNVKDAHAKGIIEVGREISEVAKRARDGKLTMDDLTGGTFTITNGGVFGSLVSTPIINYPQSGILGLHKTQDRPVAIAGKVEIRPMMYVALSYDHRIVEGQHAVLFLVRIKELIEDPAAMLIS
ncbi:MAG TPA: 2-oxoglutarate dehydrogenase complex dihydrolipoyllysine-residue succinyltransferase [Gemmatimonadaceae bacterium]|nr:2-oxoglutarate dehydrogenase complex dihydrolipoyllysine-residue succinyltransferase [Gemmatimonadaceae bacterium]